jgi:hypothetical protein
MFSQKNLGFVFEPFFLVLYLTQYSLKSLFSYAVRLFLLWPRLEKRRATLARETPRRSHVLGPAIKEAKDQESVGDCVCPFTFVHLWRIVLSRFGEKESPRR